MWNNAQEKAEDKEILQEEGSVGIWTYKANFLFSHGVWTHSTVMHKQIEPFTQEASHLLIENNQST